MGAGEVLALPMAHGEGRFTSARAGHVAELLRAGQVPLRYCDAEGRPAAGFPDNPNGADEAAAAVCNPAGNVLAIMPHPERAQDLLALARSAGGRWAERREAALDGDGGLDLPGPGLALFHGLAAAAGTR
jgi:phosphoribosylformylglycinamidine (FGAM) synthase-like amidotransferase family enzyme